MVPQLTSEILKLKLMKKLQLVFQTKSNIKKIMKQILREVNSILTILKKEK